MSQNIPMTIRGKQLLENELDQLIKIEREAIKKAISDARELGDLKENAEYHAAKEKQSHIEGRILEIQGKINTANIVDISKLGGDKIIFGATVTIYDTQRESSITYQIVGDDEAQVDPSKISYNSPIAKSLIGKEAGDTVTVKAPKGEIEYEIEDVQYI